MGQKDQVEVKSQKLSLQTMSKKTDINMGVCHYDKTILS